MTCPLCKKPENSPTGLLALIEIEKGFDRLLPCPVGYTTNPNNEKAAKNLISNGGRFQICENNPWKWANV